MYTDGRSPFNSFPQNTRAVIEKWFPKQLNRIFVNLNVTFVKL